jgi:hypothetical protein
MKVRTGDITEYGTRTTPGGSPAAGWLSGSYFAEKS